MSLGPAQWPRRSCERQAARLVDVGKRQRPERLKERCDELGLALDLIVRLLPGHHELIVIGKLPEVAATPVPHRVTAAEAGEGVQALTQVAGPADVDDARALYPPVRQRLDRSRRVLALEVTSDAGVEELRCAAG